MKRIISLLIILSILLSFSACTTEEEKMKQAAQVPVDEFMQAFCVLDMRKMGDSTDADLDYSEYEFLSLEELKNRMLIPFAVFKTLGVPMEEFDAIVDEIFAAYEKYAAYNIIDARVEGEEVIFEVNAEYVTLTEMTQILNNAVDNVDMESLESQLAVSILTGGAMALFGGASNTDAIMTAVAPVIESIKVEVTRSIENLKPKSGTITLVTYQKDGKWVISDDRSDVGFLSEVFK